MSHFHTKWVVLPRTLGEMYTTRERVAMVTWSQVSIGRPRGCQQSALSLLTAEQPSINRSTGNLKYKTDLVYTYKNRWRTFSCLFYWDRPHSCAPKGGIFIHLLPTTLAPISAVPLKRTASQPIPRLKNETRSSEEVKINALAEVKYSLPLFLNRCNLRSYHTYKENLFRVVFRRPEPETGRRGVVFISYLPGGEAETGETIVSLGGAATAVGKWRDLLLLPIFGPHVLSVGIRQVKIIFQLDGFSITRDGTWKWHTVCSRTLLHVFCFFYGTKLLSIGLRRRRDHATHVVSGADCVFPQLRKQHFHSAFGEIELLTKSINFDGGGLISWPKIGQKQLVAHHPRGRALFSLLFVVEWKRPWMNWALGARVGVDARAPRRWAAVSVGIDQWRPAAHAIRLRREKSLPQGRRAWIGRHCCCCCRFPMRYWSSREPPFRQQPPPPPPPEALFILNIHLHAHSRKVGEREKESGGRAWEVDPIHLFIQSSQLRTRQMLRCIDNSRVFDGCQHFREKCSRLPLEIKINPATGDVHRESGKKGGALSIYTHKTSDRWKGWNRKWLLIRSAHTHLDTQGHLPISFFVSKKVICRRKWGGCRKTADAFSLLDARGDFFFFFPNFLLPSYILDLVMHLFGIGL